MLIDDQSDDSTSVISDITDAVANLEESFLVQLHDFLTIQLFNLQNTPVTIYSLMMFLLFLTIFAIGGKVISRIIFFRFLGNVQMDEGIRFTLMRFTNYFIIFIGVVISFQFIGIDLSGLAVIFGLLSVGIGFGLQNVTSNFIAGLILLIERPIKIGDRIIVNDMEGDVKEINMRSTTIQSLLNISIIVPNADFISGSVVNYSYGGDTRVRVRVNVGVSYGSDLDLVIKCLRDAALNHPEVLKDPAPVVVFRDFGDSSWDLSVTSWISDAKRHIIVASEIRMNIVRIFRDHDVEIPFPQRDINFRNIMEMKSNSDERPLKPGEPID
ncbi:MAG: mechanosensitive ion channel [Bacteroidetes bacterium]|nr:mechanosensitive ion channel [Bacteroidota bacterium]MCH8523185.1 mechanosensitive ion channel [Balneolales bacterium]